MVWCVGWSLLHLSTMRMGWCVGWSPLHLNTMMGWCVDWSLLHLSTMNVGWCVGWSLLGWYLLHVSSMKMGRCVDWFSLHLNIKVTKRCVAWPPPHFGNVNVGWSFRHFSFLQWINCTVEHFSLITSSSLWITWSIKAIVRACVYEIVTENTLGKCI